MIKRRSDLSPISGGIVVLALFVAASPGCKKQEKPAPAPPAAHVQPLPQKGVQANVSGAKQPKATTGGTAVQPPAGAKPGQATPVPPATSAPAPAGPAQVKPASVSTPQPANTAVQSQSTSAKRLATPATVNLDFSNRRDPFRPFVQSPAPVQPGAGKSVKAAKAKDLLPIQSFDTDKFRISGIITGVKENSALIIDPKGKGYVVREGMLIGSNDGRIKRITNSSIEVEEQFKDDNGKIKKRLVKLSLKRKQ
jgi:type IV pilus assembly protein PilP